MAGTVKTNEVKLVSPNGLVEKTVTVSNDGVVTIDGNEKSDIVNILVKVYKSSTQSLAIGNNLLTFDVKEFDLSSSYNTSTNKFQPTIAGYYNLSCTVSVNGQYSGAVILFKNGSVYAIGNSSIGDRKIAETLVYLNGTTDYIQAYIDSTSTGTISNLIQNTYFSAYLVRKG